MTNGDAGRIVWNDLLRAISSEYRWPVSADYGGHGFFFPERQRLPFPAENHAPLLGRYDSGTGAFVSVTSGPDELIAELPGQPPLPLRPDGTGRFWTPPFLNISVSFIREGGKVAGLRLEMEGAEKYLRKMDQLTEF